MFRDKNLVTVFGGKHCTSVKPHAQRRHMGTELLGWRGKFTARVFLAKLWIRNVSAVTIGVAEVEPLLRRMIQLIRWNIVAQVIAPVISEPQLFGHRMPVETHGIADTSSKYLRRRSVRLHAADKRVTILVGLTYIARRSYGNVEQPVGAKSDKLPSVMAVLWKLVIDRDRLWGIGETGLDIIVAE